MRIGVICAVLTGCVDEYDTDVFVILPEIPAACDVLEAAQVRVAIETIDGEHYDTVDHDCRPSLGGQTASGFQIQLARLTDGYHHATTTIEMADGSVIGSIERPFEPTTSLIIPFSRADLPAWPTSIFTLGIPCVDPAVVQVTLTPALSTRAVFDGPLSCGDHVLVAPRGPIAIVALATDTCSHATTEAQVDDFGRIDLELEGSCP